MWIQEETGKPLPGTLGERPSGKAVWVEDCDVPCELDRDDKDRSWIPGHLAKQLLHVETERASVKAYLAGVLRALDGRENYLHYLYDEAAEAIVKGELVVMNEGKKTPKKSYKMPFGNTGFKMGRDKTEVLDKDKAIAWAEKNHPAAVEVITDKKLLKSELPIGKLKANEIPGIKFIAKTNGFFLTPSKPK